MVYYVASYMDWEADGEILDNIQVFDSFYYISIKHLFILFILIISIFF